MKTLLMFILAAWFALPVSAANDVQKITALADAGQPRQALQQIEQILKGSPHHVEALFLKAKLLTETDRPKAAIAVYQSLTKTHPDLPEPYNNLAILYARQGDMEAARRTLEQGINTHPSYAAIYDNLSAVYVEMARDSYGKALRLGIKPHELKLQHLAAISGSIRGPIIESGKLSKPAMQTAPIKTAPTQTVVARKKAPIKSGTIQRVVTQAKTTPIKKPPVARVSATVDTITTTLQGWATAWSSQEVDLYLSFYGSEFNPPQGLSRRTWERQRRLRLGKPRWVQVTLNDFQIGPPRNGKVAVRLIQEYRSDGYSDQTRKEFVLGRSNGEWRILAEKSLETLSP